jgi:hypothetical protein
MRLGDDIDDYCSRCQLSAGHAVVSMVADDVKKVRCRTCGYEHNYRRNKGGKKQMSAHDAFQQLMAQAGGAESFPEKKKSKK